MPRNFRSYYARKYTPRRKYSYAPKRRFGAFKKKRFNKYRITKSTQGSTIASDKTFTKLKVSTLTSISLAAASYTASGTPGNSFTTVPYFGDYASGMAAYGALYGKFRILGSSIKVEASNISANSVTVGIIARSPSDNMAITESNVLDQTYVTYKQLAPVGNGSKATLKMFMKTKKMFGAKVTQDPNAQGSFTYTSGTNTILSIVDPANTWQFEVFMATSAPQTASCDLVVTQSFYVQFEDRRFQTSTLAPV